MPQLPKRPMKITPNQHPIPQEILDAIPPQQQQYHATNNKHGVVDKKAPSSPKGGVTDEGELAKKLDELEDIPPPLVSFFKLPNSSSEGVEKKKKATHKAPATVADDTDDGMRYDATGMPPRAKLMTYEAFKTPSTSTSAELTCPTEMLSMALDGDKPHQPVIPPMRTSPSASKPKSRATTTTTTTTKNNRVSAQWLDTATRYVCNPKAALPPPTDSITVNSGSSDFSGRFEVSCVVSSQSAQSSVLGKLLE